MLIETNKQRLLAYLFENPTRKAHLRELARFTGMSAPSVLRNAEILQKENMAKIERGALTMISANAEDKNFIWMKRVYNMYSIYSSGLVDFLQETFDPDAIALFGSFSRGEDIERSDIDIALISGGKASPDLSKFEKKLHRSISLHQFGRKEVSQHFWKSISNGIILEGALE